MLLKYPDCDIEARQPSSLGLTPLLQAAEQGDAELVGLLLSKGADVNATDTGGRTALLYAADRGHATIVESLLLGKGRGRGRGGAVDTEAKTKSYGRTALISAASNGHETVVRLLLDAGADMEARDAHFHRTPLLWAASQGHETVVRLLLDRGADREAKGSLVMDAKSMSAVHGAAEGVMDIMTHLFLPSKQVSSPNQKERNQRLAAMAKDAARDSLGEFFDVFAGADEEEQVGVGVSARRSQPSPDKDRRDRETALSLAIKNGHDAIVSLLTEAGPANIKNSHRDTARPPVTAPGINKNRQSDRTSATAHKVAANLLGTEEGGKRSAGRAGQAPQTLFDTVQEALESNPTARLAARRLQQIYRDTASRERAARTDK